jgi:Zn-dependent membrane protease YugP
MLADNGIRESDFNPGRLTDHYNPSDKTVNLSEAVYNQRMPQLLLLCSRMSRRTTCSGWLQWLTMRSKLVPVVNVASSYMQWILLGGILLLKILSAIVDWDYHFCYYFVFDCDFTSRI